MRVTEVCDDWPERSLRRRRWLSPAAAVDKVDERDLRDLLRDALLGGPGA
jgi:hypothetical protein